MSDITNKAGIGICPVDSTLITFLPWEVCKPCPKCGARVKKISTQ